MAQFIVNRKNVTNLDRMIEFELDGARLTRRLVLTATCPTEVSIASPVGAQLANAQPGDPLQITLKGEEGYLFGKVLSVGGVQLNALTQDSLAQAAA